MKIKKIVVKPPINDSKVNIDIKKSKEEEKNEDKR